MKKLWSFLQQQKNRQVLGWLGGGIVVLAGGVWVVITFFYSPHPPPQALDVSVEAPGGFYAGRDILGSSRAQDTVFAPGGVAAGRDIVGSTINIGIPPEQVAVITEALKREQKLTDEQRQTIAELEGNLGVSAGALRTFFRTLGENEVPPERQETKLVEIAERYKQLLAQVAAAPGDDPDVAKLKGEAKAALDAGQLERADNLLAQVQAAQDAALERRQLEAAATVAQRGEISLTLLNYLEAAQHFKAASERIPSFNLLARAYYLNRYADALYWYGDFKGDNAVLREVIEVRHKILQEFPRDGVPLQWAWAQTGLGVALEKLGEREGGTKRLEEAVEAHRAALQEYTRERDPLDWADTLDYLGNALRLLGEREGSTKRLEEAVEAHRAALQEYTRERYPLQWAWAQNGLGNALGKLGEREGGTKRLEEAVEAYRAGLQESTRERYPLGWAWLQNNLGNALRLLGERESGTKRLEEAVEAYRDALKERTHERVPPYWAGTQANLGRALGKLGEREGGTKRLEEAVEAHRAALQEYTRERYPLGWAWLQNNLGNVLRLLGQRESGTKRLEEAVEAHRAALQVWTREQAPGGWAITKCNLADALINLDKQYKNIAYRNDALTELHDIFQAIPPEKAPNVLIDSGCIWSGAISIYNIIYKYFGDTISYQQISEEIAESIIKQNMHGLRIGPSFLDLKAVAEHHGYEATGFGNVSINDVISLPKGRTILFLAYLNRKTLAVLNGVQGKQLCLADPVRGNICISMTQFAQEWVSETKFGKTALIIDKAGFGSTSDALKGDFWVMPFWRLIMHGK